MTTRFDDAWVLLPDFGRIKHLPYKPNTDRDDLVATPLFISLAFDRRIHGLSVEEKIDGSQVAINFSGDIPIIRNKNHVLVKGYGRKHTPAKAQYAPLWNWVYANADRFENLEQIAGMPVSVYGEWIYAEHTICYDLAPDDFIAYEVFVPTVNTFLDAERARTCLEHAGFTLPFAQHFGNSVSIEALYTQLEFMTQQPSRWSSCDKREGVMVKVSDDKRLLHRFKMRREDFKPREDFNDTPLRRRGAK